MNPLEVKEKKHIALHGFFSWFWCIVFFALTIWGGFAFYVLKAQGAALPLSSQQAISIILAAVVGVCILIATCLRKRYPNWLGPVQFAGTWAAYPVLRVIHEGYPISRDALLYNIDSALWGGQTLPHWVKLLEAPWLTELLSFCYFTFYFIILSSVVYFMFKPRPNGRAFFYGLMLMYLFGILGYIAVPAAGPYAMFPAEFPYPPAGGGMTQFLVTIVAQGITGMDVFPSLHCGITLYIMGFCMQNGYRKAALLLLPLFVGITVATVYLRYHYGIDLIVGIALALFVLYYVRCYKEKNLNA